MKIIVGLGNPGQKYQKTRHNTGFRVIDELTKKNRFPDFCLSKKFNAQISEGNFNNEKIILAKPQTFMNNSGKAVKFLINFYRTTRPGLVVIHDDIDLPLGKIKIVKNRGSAGHKGVESIIKELKILKKPDSLTRGTNHVRQVKNFARFRIGIQPKSGKPKNVKDFVLKKFNRDEERVLQEVIKKTAEAIEMAIKEGLEKTMVKFNR